MIDDFIETCKELDYIGLCANCKSKLKLMPEGNWIFATREVYDALTNLEQTSHGICPDCYKIAKKEIKEIRERRNKEK